MAATDVRTRDAGTVAHEYFHAIRRGDPSPQRENYAPDATITVPGILEDASPQELIAYFEQMWAAFPDFRFEVLDIVADGDRAACHWRITGTFAGAPFMGLEPTGGRIDQRGVDYIRVRDGKIVRNDAYTDGMTLSQQLGVLPPADSAQERSMKRLVNVRTRIARRTVAPPEPIADGVWIIRGGFPQKTMNVYFVRDGDGVLMFDAGIRQMRNGAGAAAASLGGLTRIVLGHGHADHRGVAPFMGVPVLCHPDNRADSEGDGGEHYFDFSKLKPAGRLFYPRMLKVWDGGPVTISDTVSEGDEIASGFRVIELPGHAPGLIGLWRESDRLALVSDCFYTVDPETGKHGPPRLPHRAFNQDSEQARRSILKLAALEPRAAWPGHAEPVTGDVRAQLEQAVAT